MRITKKAKTSIIHKLLAFILTKATLFEIEFVFLYRLSCYNNLEFKPPKAYAEANKLYLYYPRNGIYENKVIFETYMKEVFECLVRMETNLCIFINILFI